jgi:hypothetical protein
LAVRRGPVVKQGENTVKNGKKHTLRLKQAVDLLQRHDTRLMIMHGPAGDEFYVVPGGMLESRDALKILARPDMRSFDDGLFPGHAQQWRISRG